MLNTVGAKIIFFGGSEFAIPTLNKLVGDGYEIAAVVTVTDKPVGRKKVLTPPPLKIIAQELGLEIIQSLNLKNDSRIISSLSSFGADVGVVASFGNIIPTEILNLPKHGFINLHPSLLPKFRGPSPIQFTLFNGEKKSGVTIMKIDKEVDHGPIIAQQELKILNNEGYSGLHDRLAKLGADMLIKILPDYLAEKTVLVEQDHTQATFTKKLSRADGKIDWNRSAVEIYNQYRAFQVWPSVWTIWNAQRLSLKELAPFESAVTDNEEVGKIILADDSVIVKCFSRNLKIIKLQLDGGKELGIREFIRGHKNFLGSILA